MLPRFRPSAVLCALIVMACSNAVVFAQSENDIKNLEKVRSAYSTGPVPNSISCGVTLDWDGFFQRMKMEPSDDEVKARLAKMKDIKISLVSRDAEHTDVKVEGADNFPSQLSDGLRQQLQGFFHTYWSLSYGRILAKRGDTFEWTPVADGYLLKMESGPVKTSTEIDKASLITRSSVESPQINAVMKPSFKPEQDGLLRLRSLDEAIELGATKMVVNMTLDYQKVGVYEVPLHIGVALPGSFSFDFTLNSCEVKGDSVAAVAK